MDNLEIKVKRIFVNIDFSIYKTVFAGFSGGADSLALLVLLNEIRKKFSFELIAVHFEHGLRGQASLDDAQWCKDFCEKQSIPYREFSLDVLQNKRENEGIEEAARRLRQQKWAEIASLEKSCVALGHHLGDKIENLFIRLFRGSNSSGLTSLRFQANIKGVNYIRPLLDMTKEQIFGFLNMHGIKEWRTDASNEDSAYRRNFIRNELLPLVEHHIPNAIDSIKSAYSAIEQDAQFIESYAKDEYLKLKGSKVLSSFLVNKIHPSLMVRVLRYFLSDNLGYDFIPSKAFMERLEETLKKNTNEKKLIPVDSRNFLSIYRSDISIEKTSEETSFSEKKIWDWASQKKIILGNFILISELTDKAANKSDDDFVFFDADELPAKLILRDRKEGDRFIPFGYDREVKASKILQNQKIKNKGSALVLEDEQGKIYWLTGVKRSDLAKVTKDTKHIVCFRIQRKVD